MTSLALDQLEILPPQDLEAEARVLGSIFLDPEEAPHVILPILRADRFYKVANAEVYRAIVAVVTAGNHPEPALVRDELAKVGSLDFVGGEDYLNRCMDDTPSAANAVFYAKRVRDRAVLRGVMSAARAIERHIHLNRAEALGDVLATCERLFTEAMGERNASGSHLLTDLVAAEVLRLKENHPITSVKIGLGPLDTITNGFRAGGLAIVAARPGAGKTSLGIHMARHVGLSGVPVGFVSLEMDGDEIAQAAIAQQAQVSAFDMRAGTVNPFERAKIADAAGVLSGAQVFVEIPASLSVVGIRSVARHLKNRRSIGFLIVDYLQLMEGTGKHGKGENRQQEVAEISRGLKHLARELKIPVVAMAQLNRNAESRDDKRPRMADLRESGSLEQDADLVILLFRESLYKPENDSLKDKAEIIVAKNRHGATGVCHVKFDARCTRFSGVV